MLCLIAPAWAQVDTSMAQKKLLSKRAAEADAYRKLAECIKGVQITSDTYVKDFVAESDQIQAAMDTFLKGVRLGTPKWFDDGSCEVPAEVTVAKLVTELTEIHKAYYKGDRIKATDIQHIKETLKKDVIKVVGMGAPREDLPPNLPAGVVEQLGGPPVPPSPPIPDLWRKIGPQGRMMAIRAAEVDAKRKLLERILGLRINSDTLVKDFVAEHDVIQTVANGTLVGATVVRNYLHHDEPIAEVTVQVPLESVITTIKELHTRSIQGDRIKGTDITQLEQSLKVQTFEATGMGIPPQKQLVAYNAQVQPTQQIPDWAQMPIRMTGNGVAPADKAGTPQGKLLAARAAELDAKRKLSEHINGLAIRSNTYVKDFVAEHDDVQTQMQGILVGSTVEKTEFAADGTAAVTVAVPGMQIWEVIATYQKVVVAPRQGG
jgi:hypothetical protein